MPASTDGEMTAAVMKWRQFPKSPYATDPAQLMHMRLSIRQDHGFSVEDWEAARQQAENLLSK